MPQQNLMKPTRGDALYEIFFCGAVGGAVIVLFFLAVDIFTSIPLYTPSLVGSVLYLGADPSEVEGISLTAISVASVVHLGSFLVVGLVASFGVRRLEAGSGGSFAVPVFGLLLGLEAASVLVFAVIRPELGEAVGHGLIFAANFLSAGAMVAFLRQARSTSEAVTIVQSMGQV